MSRLRGVCVGAGYFSHFHYDAWSRIPEAEIVAACDLEESKIRDVAGRFGIPKFYTDFETMIDEQQPDFIDIITPPPTHLPLVTLAAGRGIDIICQKPLAPDIGQAREMVEKCEKAGVRFMVHENFRWQPWHREIKKLLDQGAIGDRLFSLNFRMRQGDGWGENAYLDRQPYFREMPRLLIYETGIHFIDVFRFLGGKVESVYCNLRRLNPVIKGEDCGMLFFQFANGAVGLWDANRYNEPNFENPRYTFGEFLVEGSGGTIRLYGDGRITVQKLGEPEKEHSYHHQQKGFAGDCVYFTQRHFIDCLLNNESFETDGRSYLEALELQEAFYQSASEKLPVDVL